MLKMDPGSVDQMLKMEINLDFIYISAMKSINPYTIFSGSKFSGLVDQMVKMETQLYWINPSKKSL